MYNMLACSGPGVSDFVFTANLLGFGSLVGCGLFALLFGSILFKEKKRLAMAIISFLMLLAHPRIYMDSGGGDCGGMMSQLSVIALVVNFSMIMWKWFSDFYFSGKSSVNTEELTNA